MTYSIWVDVDGGPTLVQGTNAPKLFDEDEGLPGQRLVRIFEAADWSTAVKALHQFCDSTRGAKP